MSKFYENIISLLKYDEKIIFNENQIIVIKEFKYDGHQTMCIHDITYKTDFESVIKNMLEKVRIEREEYINKLKKGPIK
jgi:hypothetical protein